MTKPYLIKVGRHIINLNIVRFVEDKRQDDCEPVVDIVFVASEDMDSALSIDAGPEADALMAFLDEEALDVVALAEVQAEDEPARRCCYEDCDQEPIPGEGLCQGHWDQEEAEMIYQAAIALHAAGECGEGCRLCEAQAKDAPLQFTSTAEAIPAAAGFMTLCCGQERDLFTTPRCPVCNSRPAIVPGSSFA
jgi:hypothetical protein